MAIITEEQEQRDSQNDTRESTSISHLKTASPSSPKANPFTFWAYFTLTVSLITLLFVSLSSLSPQDPKTWFLSLPNELRLHYSKGRTVKVQTDPFFSPIEVFTIEEGRKASDRVLIVHGLGCSSYSFRKLITSLGLQKIRAVAVDLPGSGFSDKSVVEKELDGRYAGVLGRLSNVYDDIKEKGLFWAFDHIIETGHMPYGAELEIKPSYREVVKPLKLGPEEVGRVLGQVIDSMALSPVHLVLHDSALAMAANWVSENSDSIRSLTLIDSSPTKMALPLWVIDTPVIRDFVLGFSILYKKFLNLYCSRSMGSSVAEAHRVLLKGRDGRQAIVEMGKKLNHSFDLAEWRYSKGIKDMPIQVIWSGNCSEEWSEEGRRVANLLPQATFELHSGCRWPQEDVAEELAEKISQFMSSLPKNTELPVEEPVPEHIQKMLDEAKGHDHHHHHHHGDGEHHVHAHTADFMDAYGLGHGWAT